jgi:hypothetical protein
MVSRTFTIRVLGLEHSRWLHSIHTIFIPIRTCVDLHSRVTQVSQKSADRSLGPSRVSVRIQRKSHKRLESPVLREPKLGVHRILQSSQPRVLHAAGAPDAPNWHSKPFTYNYAGRKCRFPGPNQSRVSWTVKTFSGSAFFLRVINNSHPCLLPQLSINADPVRGGL